jgi:hypothetical protein
MGHQMEVEEGGEGEGLEVEEGEEGEGEGEEALL